MGRSCRTLLWDTPVGHTLRTRLPPKVTLRGCKTSVSYETSSKSHAPSLKNERFVRDFLQKSHVKSPKRAFRTRLPPKVTCQVPKTSVLYETSSKTHMSKSAKRTSRTRLPPKVQRKHPSEHTHHAALPSSFAIPAPPNDLRHRGAEFHGTFASWSHKASVSRRPQVHRCPRKRTCFADPSYHRPAHCKQPGQAWPFQIFSRCQPATTVQRPGFRTFLSQTPAGMEKSADVGVYFRPQVSPIYTWVCCSRVKPDEGLFPTQATRKQHLDLPFRNP